MRLLSPLVGPDELFDPPPTWIAPSLSDADAPQVRAALYAKQAVIVTLLSIIRGSPLPGSYAIPSSEPGTGADHSVIYREADQGACSRS
jgi:hypothetical protein